MTQTPKQALLAAVEGGGTSFVVTVALLKPSPIENITIAHTKFEILHQQTILTTTPSETLANTCKFFRKHCPDNGYDALGICTFGPVGVNESDESNYGHILPGSPKKDWRNVNILSPILNACSSIDGKRQPVYKVETDVNAPAIAEYEYMTRFLKKSMTSLAYVTVGTGIGVGLVVNDKPVHGMMHPEGGHVPIIPLSGDDFAYSWGDKSPFQGRNTVEGTASSVALSERLGVADQMMESCAFGMREGLKDLSDDHPSWDHAANALANLCVTLALVTSVEKIVLGGGIMNRVVLYEKVRIRTRELLNGYLDLPQVTTDAGLEEYISPSVWKDEGPGLVGALVMAQVAYEEASSCSSDDAKAAPEKSALESESGECSNSTCTTSRGAGQCPMKTLALYGSIFALGAIIGSKRSTR